MDVTSASSSSREAAQRSSNVSHSSTGVSQVMDGVTSRSQGITAATVPGVHSSLADPSFQPSALVFRSGIAFDYENFPRILSVCWPVFNIDSGTPLIARDGPERSLTQISANETITLNNDVPPSGGSVFTWGSPHSVPVAKDPVISTPEKKAPVGITIRDSCEIQTKKVISNTDESLKTTAERQEEATTAPQLSQKQRWSYYEPAESATSKKEEISAEKHFKKSSFDNIQLNANKRRSDSDDATITNDLGGKRTRTEPVQAGLCHGLSADNKQSGFKTQEMLCPVNFESEKSDHECHCIQTKERPDAEECDTMATSKEDKISSSSAEAKSVEEDKSGCKATAEVFPLNASFNLRVAENHPIVKEDNFVSEANKTGRSEESHVFCSSPPRQSDGNHSTLNLQQCSRLEKEHKQENVRDLITRIKYIKSRLDRAESDYRKKRMLKAIISLQKRVKALVKDMNREKIGPAKGQQETSSSHEGLQGQESVDNTVLGSQGTNTTDRERPVNHVTTDQGGVSLPQALKDSSKDNTGKETPKICKELAVVSSPVVIVSHDNDVTSNQEKTTFRHSEDVDVNSKNNNNKNNSSNNNNRREDRGSLSLITSNGSVDDRSLRLPFGIGLDYSPCGKRAASPSELDENDFQKDQIFKAKKMKRLSSLDEDAKKIDSRLQDATHHIQDDALDASELNEMNEVTNSVESGAANASQHDECTLLIRKEFSSSNTDCVTVTNSTDAAQGISAEHKSIIDDDVQAEENNRKTNDGTGKDCSGGDVTNFNCNDNKSNGDVEMIEIHEHNSCPKEMQDVTFNVTPVEDNSSGQEEKHCSSSLENIIQEEVTQGFTSPAIHNPSGRQEDVDLTQSLQIREARILNLTRKRDRLLNLTVFK